MNAWSTVLGLAILAAARQRIRLLEPGNEVRAAWHRLYGAVVWNLDWPDGLWSNE